jgi:hypothetical protein
MNLYYYALGLGFTGLLLMAAGGMGRGRGGARTARTARMGGARSSGMRGTVRGASTPRGGRLAPPRSGGRVARSTGRTASRLLGMLEPRVAFTVLLATGAVGVAVQPWLSGTVQAVVSLLGGGVFEALLAGPFFRLLLGFASAPALTLESALFDLGHASSGFDATGSGVVTVELDGQVVQVLGVLVPEEREAGVRVRAGDEVRISGVDAERGRCLVSKLDVG